MSSLGSHECIDYVRWQIDCEANAHDQGNHRDLRDEGWTIIGIFSLLCELTYCIQIDSPQRHVAEHSNTDRDNWQEYYHSWICTKLINSFE
jgi:hypothetical protein